MNINWKKPGQVVKVGYQSNVESPYWGTATVNLFVDEYGNFFGCDAEPKFNPITGEKINEINYVFAKAEYDTEYLDLLIQLQHDLYTKVIQNEEKD